MGNEDGGLVVLPHQADEFARRSRAVISSSEEKVRRIAGFPDRPQKRGRWTPAGACRRKARADSRFRVRKAQTAQASGARSLPPFGIGVEDLQSQQHIVERCPPGHQPIVLEHNADLAAEKIEIAERVVADHFGFAGGRLDQAGDDIEHGGLAAAGLAKHGDDLALADFK